MATSAAKIAGYPDQNNAYGDGLRPRYNLADTLAAKTYPVGTLAHNKRKDKAGLCVIAYR
ncbi:hypothetical protein CEK71_15315 [Methylovulum psychrotolerans]|uniref:Uncharacterized protein n=1 Tax=Methylovulum psychrotolerans TaxID=1704499 RepID=A0A1Z4C1D2_9GAMM|nr:hypothetical protein CEK71_15315 [Methylovulum psychrotolerans]